MWRRKSSAAILIRIPPSATPVAATGYRCAQRPGGELREPPVRWSVRLCSVASLHNLIRPHQQRWRDRETDRLGGFHIDDQFEVRGLLHRQVSRLSPLENLGQ